MELALGIDVCVLFYKELGARIDLHGCILDKPVEPAKGKRRILRETPVRGARQGIVLDDERDGRRRTAAVGWQRGGKQKGGKAGGRAKQDAGRSVKGELPSLESYRGAEAWEAGPPHIRQKGE